MQIKNKYEFIFIIIIFSQIFGVIGGFLQPIRFLSVIIFIYLLDKIPQRIVKDYKSFFIFFGILIFYSFIYIVISFDRIEISEMMKASFYNIINFIVCFNLIVLSYKIQDIKNVIIKGWLLFLVFAIPISLYEIFFNHHFVTVIEDGTLVGGTNNLKTYSSLTFGNYNNYNMILMMSLPFLFDKLYYKNSYILTFILIFISYIFLINGSRTALFSIFISFIIFSILKRNFQFFLLIVTLIILFLLNLDKFEYTFNRLSELGLEDEGRSRMFEISYLAFIDSNLIGLGPGYFKYYVLNNNLSDLLAQHNFLLEILSEYGIIIFMLLFMFLMSIFKSFKKEDKSFRLIILLTFIPIIIINSTYIQGVSIWIYLIMIFLINKRVYEKH